MALDTSFGGTRKPAAEEEGIHFLALGVSCTLPAPSWYAEALRSFDEPLAPLGGEAQVIWLLEGENHAAETICGLAPGTFVSGAERSRPGARTVLVGHSAARPHAPRDTCGEPLFVLLGPPAGPARNTVYLPSADPAQAAALAGILASLMRYSRGFDASEALSILVSLAHVES